MKANDVVEENLIYRLNQIEKLVESARLSVIDGDIFQAAIRIEEISKFCNFEKFVIDIFESLGKEE